MCDTAGAPPEHLGVLTQQVMTPTSLKVCSHTPDQQCHDACDLLPYMCLNHQERSCRRVESCCFVPHSCVCMTTTLYAGDICSKCMDNSTIIYCTTGGFVVEIMYVGAVEFDSFAALIQATKERDAARKAKQQQAQVAAPAAAVCAASLEAEAAARAAVPQAVDQSCDQDHCEAAQEQPDECPEWQPLGSGTQLPAYSAHAQPPDKPNSATLSKSMSRGVLPVRRKSQDGDYGSMHSNALDPQTVQNGERSESQQWQFAEDQSRVDLTLADTPGRLSQESLAVEVEDEASPVSSQKVQDQRALQQLQLLHNSTEPVTVTGACSRKSIQLSQDKEVAVSNVPYQGFVAQLGRTEDCLGPLDDIIEDSDSDIEGLMQ